MRDTKKDIYTQVTHIPIDRVVVWIGFACLLIVSVAYMYFVAQSVVEAVMRNDLAISIRAEESRIAKLESVYLTRLETLTPAVLHAYGLASASPSAYLTIGGKDGRLTRRE